MNALLQRRMASASESSCRFSSKLVVNIVTIIVTFSTLSILASGENGCPPQCLCYVDDDNGLKTANCTGVEFVSFSGYSKLYSDIEVLNIKPHNDKLIKLSDDMFYYFVKLKQLNLSKCRIKNIPKNVFKGLKKIVEINLSDNEIQHFHSSVFENVYTLYKLSLRGNPLQISFKPFIISNNLKELDLGNCGISMLQNEFFHGLKLLNHLYLDGNYLQTIKEHVLPRGLTYLNLANNKIVNVPIEAIFSLNQLRRLNLNGNFINCTCAVLNLQDWLSGHGVIIDGEVKCTYPIELENVSLTKVNENEVCDREIFSEKAQHRKSQSPKYMHQKKDNYFENEKYSSYESLQGDQPDDADYPQDNTDNEKADFEETGLEESNKNDAEIDNEKRTDKPEVDKTVSENTITKPSDQIIKTNITESEHVHADSENTTPKTDENLRVTSEYLNKINDLDETKSIVKDEKENETDDNKSPKKSDHMPDEDENTNIGKADNTLEESDGHDDNEHSAESENMGGIENDNDNEEVSIKSETEGHNNASDNSNIDTNKEAEEVSVTHSHETEVQQGPNDQYKNKLIESTTPSKNRDHDLFEGSGTDEKSETTLGGIIEFEPNTDVSEDDSPAYIDPNISIYESDKTKLDSESKDEENHKPENDVKEGAVETQMTPVKYESLGQYIVVGGIALLVAVLLLVSIYKGCKSNTTKRDPIPDVEANNGVELQDMASLLPKPQVKEEIISSKYPNEVPSNETVNLIKGEKTEDSHDPIDLNQNANRNEAIIKNGKSATDGLGPIEVTKVKLTVLPDSVPRTPVIVQKRSATINNGV